VDHDRPIQPNPVRVRALSSLFLAAALLVALSVASARAETPAHGLAMHGDLKYPPGFQHFDYVNPNAPKGGLLRLSDLGTFDSLNPYILKGVAANTEQVFETLLASSADEPFSEYGLIAESVEVPADRSWVIFNLRPEARFHDGSPITADDVVFSFDILRAKGHPQLRFYYSAVAKAEAEGPRRVKFTFVPGENRELPLIIGQMPILSKAYWQTREFDKTTLEPPLGSGPYRVESVDPGRSITLKRVEDYWGAKLAVNVGRYNFDRIRTDYYRDGTVALEAFKAGQFDLRMENVSKYWATAYDIPAVNQGLIKKEDIPNGRSTGMQSFAFNARRALFADKRVREALDYAFDFEWTNRNLFYGAYTRTESYFSNSELASTGLPQGQELAVLEPFRDRLAPEVFTTPFTAPKTDGNGNVRPNLLKALDILGQAGWHVAADKLVNDAGQPFKFEILLYDPSFERIVLPFVRNLKRIGIDASLRVVDVSQYQNRVRDFDFDMIIMSWGESLSPGNEQRNFWTSRAAETPGSRNVVGIKDPVVDALVDMVVAAPDREALVARTRALDRTLLWGHYVIPQWHLTTDRVAYWNKLSRPAVTPTRGVEVDAWWIDPNKEQVLNARIPEVAIQPPPNAAAAETPTADAPPSEPVEAKPEWWRWAMVAAVLALAIWRWQRRRKR
jgi:microcin C transport system substrate-binding protein